MGSETSLCLLTIVLLFVVPGFIWHVDLTLAIILGSFMLIANFYFLPKYTSFIKAKLDAESINFDKFAELIPENMQGEGAKQPVLEVFSTAKNRHNKLEPAFKNTRPLNVSQYTLESESLDLASVWGSYSPYDVVEILISMEWMDNSLDVLKRSMDNEWAVLGRYQDTTDVYNISTWLTLGESHPQNIFRQRQVGEWQNLDMTYMTEQQTCGYGITYYVENKNFFCTIDNPVWKYFLGYFLNPFFGLYLLYKERNRHIIRQRYKVWVSDSSHVQKPQRIPQQMFPDHNVISIAAVENAVEIKDGNETVMETPHTVAMNSMWNNSEPGHNEGFEITGGNVVEGEQSRMIL